MSRTLTLSPAAGIDLHIYILPAFKVRSAYGIVYCCKQTGPSRGAEGKVITLLSFIFPINKVCTLQSADYRGHVQRNRVPANDGNSDAVTVTWKYSRRSSAAPTGRGTVLASLSVQTPELLLVLLLRKSRSLSSRLPPTLVPSV